jgi:hypothetical protein
MNTAIAAPASSTMSAAPTPRRTRAREVPGSGRALTWEG